MLLFTFKIEVLIVFSVNNNDEVISQENKMERAVSYQ